MKVIEGVVMPCCPICDQAIFNYHRTEVLEHQAMKALVHADCVKDDEPQEDEDWSDEDESEEEGED